MENHKLLKDMSELEIWEAIKSIGLDGYLADSKPKGADQ